MEPMAPKWSRWLQNGADGSKMEPMAPKNENIFINN
jgi:hypothetical protein